MTHGNTQGRHGPMRPITESDIAPSVGAWSSGRIRTLAEARQALQLPKSVDPEGLRHWGTPWDYQLKACPVSDSDQPEIVAEFATLRVLSRRGTRLAPLARNGRFAAADLYNLWIVYGSIMQIGTHPVALEHVAVGPAFADQFTDDPTIDTAGVTGELLRLTPVHRLLRMVVEDLQRNGFWLDVAAARGHRPMPAKQRQLLDRLDQHRPRTGTIPDEELAELAKRYLQLHIRGLRHLLPQLAHEFGISRDQARDRVHKARARGYLTEGTQGRAGAAPGPRLKVGWQPPTPITTADVANRDNEALSRSPRKRR